MVKKHVLVAPTVVRERSGRVLESLANVFPSCLVRVVNTRERGAGKADDHLRLPLAVGHRNDELLPVATFVNRPCEDHSEAENSPAVPAGAIRFGGFERGLDLRGFHALPRPVSHGLESVFTRLDLWDVAHPPSVVIRKVLGK